MANNSMTATGIEEQKQQALSDSEKMYTDMANKSDEFYQAQIAESQKWADRMAQIQQERTDFAIEQIEQQKEQAQKDYIKEQSGAYVDWQKESNKYGANAEQMASAGLKNDGYGESSQVSIFNTYQNRVATAREAISRAMLDFDNAIKDARLQNSAAQAEIAYNALQQQMGLALQGFQYKNQLLTEQANKRMEIDTNYFNRYLSVLKELEGDGGTSPFVGTYKEAAEYLRMNGFTQNDGGLMTEKEWLARKSRGGTGSEMNYSSYQEYLNNYVIWKSSNPD